MTKAFQAKIYKVLLLLSQAAVLWSLSSAAYAFPNFELMGAPTYPLDGTEPQSGVFAPRTKLNFAQGFEFVTQPGAVQGAGIEFRTPLFDLRGSATGRASQSGSPASVGNFLIVHSGGFHFLNGSGGPRQIYESLHRVMPESLVKDKRGDWTLKDDFTPFCRIEPRLYGERVRSVRVNWGSQLNIRDWDFIGFRYSRLKPDLPIGVREYDAHRQVVVLQATLVPQDETFNLMVDCYWPWTQDVQGPSQSLTASEASESAQSGAAEEPSASQSSASQSEESQESAAPASSQAERSSIVNSEESRAQRVLDQEELKKMWQSLLGSRFRLIETSGNR